MSPRVLVTDAQDRSMLAACRSLAAAGYTVSAAAGVRPAAGHWSRACRKRFHVPLPLHDPTGFVDGLAEILAREKHDVLMLGSDASVLTVSEHRDRLEHLVRLGLPSRDTVRRCVDKRVLVEEAAAAGLSCPETISCSSLAEARSAAETLGLPVVLKPRQTVFEIEGQPMQQSGTLAWDVASLSERFADFGNPCLLQKVVSGPTISCSGVIAGEEMIAFATSRYARTFPPDGGPVAFAQTVEPPAGLEHSIRKLLTGLGWQGVFEVELVESDGRLFTIDFNPRPFGSLELISKAGAPLAAVWCDRLLGREPGRVTARPGVRYRWEDADIRHFWWQLRRGRLGAALGVIRPRRRVAHAFFRLSDPGPLLARLLYLLGRAFNRSDQDSLHPVAKTRDMEGAHHYPMA
jgi:predicted ATP-grasp superfamily ATP-dependent carboligase